MSTLSQIHQQLVSTLFPRLALFENRGSDRHAKPEILTVSPMLPIDATRPASGGKKRTLILKVLQALKVFLYDEDHGTTPASITTGRTTTGGMFRMAESYEAITTIPTDNGDSYNVHKS